MKGKKGEWVKPAETSGNPMFPGGYKGYEYKREEPDTDYPKTAQQKKVAKAGREIAEKCAGKEGSDFTRCRAEVLDSIF